MNKPKDICEFKTCEWPRKQGFFYCDHHVRVILRDKDNLTPIHDKNVVQPFTIENNDSSKEKDMSKMQ